MRTQIAVGLLMIASGPVALVLGSLAERAGSEYHTLAAVLFVFGLIGSVWFGMVGYRVLRGSIAVSDLPVHFALVIFFWTAAALTGWCGQAR